MKRNLKLLSGILMASFLSNNSLIPMEDVKARSSRSAVVNSTSNNIQKENKSNKELNEETNNVENIDDTTNNETSSENSTENETNSENSDENTETNDQVNDSDETQEGTTNILEMLNSDDSITKDKILELATPVSYSLAFLDEFKSTFPDLDPLRKISPILKSSDDYLDINSKEIKNVTKFLNGTPSQSIFSEQNNANILLNAIGENLSDLDKEIEKELPSTVFSLMPTLTVFSDTYRILSEEYNSIISNNSKNQINLNILLQNIEGRLLSLLNSINDFKSKLPELIEELDKLANSFNSNSSNTEAEDSNQSSENEIENTEEDLENNEEIEGEVEEETQDNLEENQDSYEQEDENGTEDTNLSEDTSEETEDSNQSSNEEVDPNEVTLYFGDSGQELVYDEETKKYYEVDPENPESDTLVEYTGNVTTMTLAEYLDMDLYFDEQGNELLYDSDTDSYFSYNSDKEEFEVYSGNVIEKKMGDLINENQEQ